jgi:hypothetical protein
MLLLLYSLLLRLLLLVVSCVLCAVDAYIAFCSYGSPPIWLYQDGAAGQTHTHTHTRIHIFKALNNWRMPTTLCRHTLEMPHIV